MADLYMDPDSWDVVISDGDLVFVDDPGLVARQAVVMTLKAFRGEWFKNIEYGTPWIKNENNDVSILGKTSKIMADSYVKGAILSNPEILSVISYASSIEPISGRMTVNATLEINDGTIQINEEIEI